MWVKICGNTSLEDALFAAESGADALGFVFAPSPRQVTVEQVGEITSRLPAGVETYGVFVDAGFEAVVNAVLEGGLSGVQLHSGGEAGLAERLHSYFNDSPGGGPLRILRALHYSERLDEELDRMRDAAAVAGIQGVLIDSRTAAAAGGTGIRFNWEAARSSFLRASPYLHLIAAGGLTPANVAEAISTLEPWGVDVVTGVESAPGKKDRSKVRAFLEAARRAGSGDRNTAEPQAPRWRDLPDGVT